ncbi:MAG TPA: hypothetical protein VKB39_07720, partial [Candidatus Baltobacteraceae bacterium]|nr:hypothetical protein [Candidatus Baltobacteraceae bacterium]
WSTANLGTLWTNTCWLPNYGFAFLAWKLGIDGGLAQAFQYFLWLAIPTIAVAFCIERLAGDRLHWCAALPLAILPFNLYITLSWPSSVACYALGSAALYAWALVEGIEYNRPVRGLAIAAAASLWLSSDAGNPPYFLIVVGHTLVFAAWLLIRNYRRGLAGAGFCAMAAAVAVLVGVRWIVPFVVTYSHYPLTTLATGGVHTYSWVTARAQLLNVLRLTPVWYWGDPSYTYGAALYQNNAWLSAGTFAPFFVALIALARAIRRQLSAPLVLFAFVLFWAFLVKSQNAPFTVLSWRIDHLPLMPLFRDSEKFLGPLLIDATIAIGLSLTGTWSRPAAALYSAATIAAVVTGGWLMLSGALFTAPRGTPPVYVRIPQEYVQLHESLVRSGATRVVVAPNDRLYEIGTKWGFFGADAEFFDDLAGVPLLRQPYVAYVDHANYDKLWRLYTSFADDVTGRTTLDQKLSVATALLRSDLMPYVGIDHDLWRDGDVSREFPRHSGSLMDLYTSGSPPLARAYSTVLGAPDWDYDRTLYDLADLGITLPLIDLTNGANLAHVAVPIVLRPQEQRDGHFSASAGSYELTARASSSGAFRREIGQSNAPAAVFKNEPILGAPSGLRTRRANAEPVGAVYFFETEGANWAQAPLELPLLGPHSDACADVAVDGKRVGRVRAGYGRQAIRVNALVPPGSFKVTVDFNGRPQFCAPNRFPARPLWTTGMAAPSTFGMTRVRLRDVSSFSRGYDVSMPLSADPTVWFAFDSTPSQKDEDIFAVLHVRGAGCSTEITARLHERVLERFNALNRRPLLSQACLSAPPERLRIEGMDLVVHAPRRFAAQPPDRIALIPARNAQNWQMPDVPRPIVKDNGVRMWRLNREPLHVFAYPTASIAIPKRCLDWMSVYLTLAGGKTAYVMQPYKFTEHNDLITDLPIGDLARDAGAKSADLIDSVDLVSVLPASERSRCALRGANVAEDATASDGAWLEVDGKRYPVPRDDLPHHYRFALANGTHTAALHGPVEAAVLLPATLSAGSVPVAATTGGLNVRTPSAEWIVFAQAADSLWHARLGNTPLPQFRADGDLQAYYVGASGPLRVYLPVTAWQPWAEAVTWLTVAALAVLLVWRWRCE